MTIIEGNKLIAKFMGFDFIEQHSRYMVTFTNFLEDDMTESYKFDRSWSWLMPVVERIESVDNGKITLIFQQKSCLIWDNSRGEELEYFDGSFKSETKIEAVYTACVEFIKWYNEQNPKS